MSSLTVEKRIEVEFSIYSMQCKECGADLSYEMKSDRFGDIMIKVEPCQCVKEAE